MLTLSDASYDTKEILKWGGLTIAGLVIVVSTILFIKQTFFPTPPPKPTLAFGKLSPQLFPKNATDKKPNYTINTLSGALPQLPDQTKVYKMLTNTPDLLNLSNAQRMASNGGFNQGQNKISDTLYEWTNSNNNDLPLKIKMDIVNPNFNITSNYQTNQKILTGKGIQSSDQSINDAQSILSNLNSFPSDLDTAKTQTELLSFKNNELITAPSISSAQVIRVVFRQQDINSLPIYYEKPNSSNINVLVGTQDKILEVNYFYQTISDQFATYPLKTTDQAFEDLKKGYAYIASYLGTSSDISINDVLLGYYLSSQNQEYIMPVFVFEGNDNFVAYVPAVTDEWIKK